MNVLHPIRKWAMCLNTVKIVLLSLLLVAVVPSCSKGGDDEEEEEEPIGLYSVTFDANGTSKKFTSDHFPVGSFYDDGAQYTGFFKATAPASFVGISIYDNKAIVNNAQYNGYIMEDGYPIIAIGAVINYQEGQTYYASPYENSNVNVKITKVTGTTITGTFSGTLKSEDDSVLVVTNGKFNVPVGTISN